MLPSLNTREFVITLLWLNNILFMLSKFGKDLHEKIYDYSYIAGNVCIIIQINIIFIAPISRCIAYHCPKLVQLLA